VYVKTAPFYSSITMVIVHYYGRCLAEK